LRPRSRYLVLSPHARDPTDEADDVIGRMILRLADAVVGGDTPT
jgi:hypothetical protein